ncbi:MAG: HEPN domain-containing protein [Prevotellaceae bacterium]|jgi:HEPN domain-containing protein|nr:HEPN domain-containing protein [Prevotellaceae bacterium]
MEQPRQPQHEQWYFQSDYDLETGKYMLKTGRNIYCIFMCHLSLEKALKGLYIKRCNEIPPRLHDLMYFIGKLTLELTEEYTTFMVWINGLSIATRYPEDLQKMIAFYTDSQTSDIYRQTKMVQQWIKAQ